MDRASVARALDRSDQMMNRPTRARSRLVSAKLITALVLRAVALIFVLQNTYEESVHCLGWTSRCRPGSGRC
jgi:hypothetical protein